MHGRWIKEHRGQLASELRWVLKGVEGVGKMVRGLGRRNGFEIEYLTSQRKGEVLTNGGGGGSGGGGGGLLMDGDAEMAEEEDGGEWIGIE